MTYKPYQEKHIFFVDGVRYNVKQWAKKHGSTSGVYYKRIKEGMTVKEACLMPIDPKLRTTGQARINREQAIASNQNKFEGMPCRKCGSTVRYTRRGAHCVSCAHDADANYRRARHGNGPV